MKHLGSLESTQEARVARVLCSPNFPRASYLDERTLTYEPIVGNVMTEHRTILKMREMLNVKNKNGRKLRMRGEIT